MTLIPRGAELHESCSVAQSCETDQWPWSPRICQPDRTTEYLSGNFKRCVWGPQLWWQQSAGMVSPKCVLVVEILASLLKYIHCCTSSRPFRLEMLSIRTYQLHGVLHLWFASSSRKSGLDSHDALSDRIVHRVPSLEKSNAVRSLLRCRIYSSFMRAIFLYSQ